MSAQTAAGTPVRPFATNPASRNSAEGPEYLEKVLCKVAVQLCVKEFGTRLQGMVLTGSLARNEGTFVRNDAGGWKLLGDAEFFLVFTERSTPAPAPELHALSARIEEELSAQGLECHISVAAINPVYLRRLHPHMFAYELRTCGLVLWGDAGLLALIPTFGPTEIPREDAWRTLSNRMIEMLEVVLELEERPKSLSPEFLYRTVKLYLDMASSFLVFASAYKPSYRERAESLRQLAASPASPVEPPFNLPAFSARVRASTRWKLSGTGVQEFLTELGGQDAALTFWEEAVSHARLLWQWELAQLTRAPGQASPRELVLRAMRLQPTRQRLRGWLFVIRKQGWQKSWRHWPQWAGRAWKGSPRYWIYGAAAEMFFRLPCLLLRPGQNHGKETDWSELRAWLPVTKESEWLATSVAWRQLASDIVSNYHQFLVETRS
jgi:hypothetical protein